MSRVIYFSILLLSMGLAIEAPRAVANDLPQVSGQSVKFERKVLDKRVDGLTLVQDFYPSGEKRTDPFLIKTSHSNKTSGLYNLMANEVEGQINSWYENGQPEYAIAYKEGQPDGQWLGWYENGDKQIEARYQQGQLISLKSWYPNGKLKQQADLTNGKGSVTTYATSGQRILVESFNKGIPDGVTERWDEQGNKLSEITYKNGLLNGVAKTWYTNGQQKTSKNLVANKPEGVVKHWYENGQLRSEVNYKNGIANGYWVYWYENGQQKVMGKMVDNKKQGLWSYWYDNGQQQAAGNLVDGKAEGTWNFWYKNGSKQAQGTMLDGLKEGQWLEWSVNGDKEYSGNYLKDKREGIWLEKNTMGQIVGETIFEQGDKKS